LIDNCLQYLWRKIGIFDGSVVRKDRLEAYPRLRQGVFAVGAGTRSIDASFYALLIVPEIHLQLSCSLAWPEGRQSERPKKTGVGFDGLLALPRVNLGFSLGYLKKMRQPWRGIEVF
jgi:hypothetical protein